MAASKSLAKLILKHLGQSEPNKYRNKLVRTEEGSFASQWEYQRWCELKALQKAGEITALGRQRRFPLVVRKLHVADYVSDFDYKEGGALVVEDTKGVLTDVYKLKRRLMQALYGITIREVRRCRANGRRPSRR